MVKKLGRRSISISGELYEDVKQFCEDNSVSASGLVTKLLKGYLEKGETPSPAQTAPAKAQIEKRPLNLEPVEVKEDKKSLQIEQKEKKAKTVRVRIHPPAHSDYPDRRGPGFKPLTEEQKVAKWRIIAEIEVSRNSSEDAVGTVQVLLQNLVHRRMVNMAGILGVEKIIL